MSATKCSDFDAHSFLNNSGAKVNFFNKIWSFSKSECDNRKRSNLIF